MGVLFLTRTERGRPITADWATDQSEESRLTERRGLERLNLRAALN